MILIGYWHNDGNDFPHPQGLVDQNWMRDRRSNIVAYLKAGARYAEYSGGSYCRFRCGMNFLGTSDLTDGRWVWPEGLYHYVEVHDVRLPDEFVAHAASACFQISRGLLDAVAEDPTSGQIRDLTFWSEWCKRHADFKYEGKCYTCAPNTRMQPPPATSLRDRIRRVLGGRGG